MCHKFGAWMKEELRKERNLPQKARFAFLWLAALLLALPSPTRAQQDTQTQAPSGKGSSSANETSQSDSLPNQPVVTSLETGQALNGKGGPLPAGRVYALWSLGHLSLLSVSTFYVYDSNLEFTPQPKAANALAIQGLFLYSIGSERTALDLQYRPYVLVYRGTAQTDLAASAIDLHTYHYLSPSWLLDLNDRFQYAPAQPRLIDPTIRPDFSTGNISRDPFLFTGQTTLTNTAFVKVSYSDESNTLTFRAQDQYVEAWNPPSSTKSTKTATSAPTLSQQENTGGVGISWSRQIDPDKLFGVGYVYDRQLIGGNANQFQYHSLMLNYSQRIRPSLQMLLSGGPSWQVPEHGATSKKFVGSAVLLKSFHASSLALSYARNYDYIGVISGGYYTRYDGIYTQSLGRRWEFSVGAGYGQQGFNKLSQFDAREEWVRGSYLLGEKLSAFLSFTNIATQGGTYPYATGNLLLAGVRWAYQRDAM